MVCKLVLGLLCLLTIVSCEWVRQMENPGLFQGDIVLTPDQREAINNGSNAYGAIKGYRWPNGEIPYEYDTSIGTGSKYTIWRAITTYHRHTCLNFKRRTDEKHYILFKHGQGCSSPVGYNNPSYGRTGVNTITLQKDGCMYKGTIMHEIGHSIGLFHEQSRPDRDDYVTVHNYNIYDPRMAYNFKKESKLSIDSLGKDYDFESMMHYDQYAFGCDRYGQNCKVTIETKDPKMQNVIGKHKSISWGDIAQINAMYSCGK